MTMQAVHPLLAARDTHTHAYHTHPPTDVNKSTALGTTDRSIPEPDQQTAYPTRNRPRLFLTHLTNIALVTSFRPVDNDTSIVRGVSARPLHLYSNVYPDLLSTWQLFVQSRCPCCLLCEFPSWLWSSVGIEQLRKHTACRPLHIRRRRRGR